MSKRCILRKIPAKLIAPPGGLRTKKVKVKVDNKVVFYDPTERVVTKTKLSLKQLYWKSQIRPPQNGQLLSRKTCTVYNTLAARFRLIIACGASTPQAYKPLFIFFFSFSKVQKVQKN